LVQTAHSYENTAHVAHISEVAKKVSSPCQFRMIHAEDDRVSPLYLKARQSEILKSCGFDVQLDVVREADVDGKFIKSADHGMGIALNLLFDKYYPTLTQQSGETDREQSSQLMFEGPKMTYQLNYTPDALHPHATCVENDVASLVEKDGSRMAS
jgi:DUF2920 family protein